MKHCFEIKTLNAELYVFCAKSEEELSAWMKEFKEFKKTYQSMMKNIGETKIVPKTNDSYLLRDQKKTDNKSNKELPKK